jgi:hypothetical protein
MRIRETNAPAVATTTAARRRDGGGSGFSVAEGASAPAAAPAAALRTIAGIEALIALQSDNEPAARRQRAVKRGRAALDALDGLKHALLAGTLDAATVRRLKAAASEFKDASGEARLDEVLAEIELRLEVEIAKLTPAQGPAAADKT